jgi:tetratricopeptide repeat protein
VITDTTLVRIGEAVQLHHQQGQRGAARDVFAQIWDEIGGERGDPLHICVLAHAMADVQDDVRQELLWDERALAAAGLLTDDRFAQAGVPMTVAGLSPSLQLNLGECHRRLGDLDRARECLERAREGTGALGDDPYGQLIKDGLEQFARRLADPEAATAVETTR